LNKRYILFTVLTALSFFIMPLVAEAQISVKSKSEEKDIAATDRYFKRNLKTAKSLIKVGNFEKAITLLKSLSNTYGNIPSIAKEIKNAYRGMKDYPALKSLVLEELEASPDSFYLVCQLGEVYFLTDSLRLADSTWEHAFELAGSSKSHYVYLASYYLGYGFYDEAVSVYRRARIALGQPELFSRELSDIFISQCDYKGAVAEFLNLLKHNPKNTGKISNQIIDVITKCSSDSLSNSSEEVTILITSAIKNDPTNPNLYVMLGDINRLAKNLTAAFENYKYADKLSNSQGRFIFSFASLCYDNSEFDMAISAADYYIESIKGKEQVKIKFIKARSLDKLGLYQQALEILDEVRDNPNDYNLKLEATLTAGDIYVNRLHNLESAEKLFAGIANNNRPSLYTYKAMMKLAEVKIMMGNYEEASVLLNSIQKSKGYDYLVEKAIFLQAEINFYAYDFKKAKAGYISLVMEYPTGFFVNDCLDRQSLIADAENDTVLYLIADASRYYYSQKADSAIAVMEQAISFTQSPAYEYILFNLACYYSETCLWDKAISAYEDYNYSYPEGLYTDRSLFNLAEIYRDRKLQPEKTDELLEKIVTDYPASPLIEKARLYLNKLKSI